jgi:RNA polymerase sigma-70 factor (ECF subfamily)
MQHRGRSTGRITLSRYLVEQHLLKNWLRLFGYAVSLTGDREAARDLLQQSALHALAAKAPPNSGGSACAWLFRIVRNAWIDQHRREDVRALAPPAGSIDQEYWHFDDRLIAELSVREALGQLEPLHREVIELIDISGFRYREAAQILGVPVGTVMSRLSRARLALLDVIGGDVRSLDAARRRTS